MFLKHTPTETLVEILDLAALWDPLIPEVIGRAHAGEEMQDPDTFIKAELAFPSGETLPQCWLNAHYRETMTYRPAKPLTRMM